MPQVVTNNMGSSFPQVFVGKTRQDCVNYIVNRWGHWPTWAGIFPINKVKFSHKDF